MFLSAHHRSPHAALAIGFLSLLGLNACTRSKSTNPTLASSAASTAHSAQPAPPVSTGKATNNQVQNDLSWRTLVTNYRWKEAAVALDSLPEEQRKRPDMRFVRARVAKELHDFALVQTLTAQLEKELPLLAPEIQELQLETLKNIGPFDVAARRLAASTHAADNFQAALAFKKAGKKAEAKAQLEKTLVRAKAKVFQAQIRAERARLNEEDKLTAAALADWQWIVLEVPGSSLDTEAWKAVQRLSPAWQPSPKQWLDRAKGLAASGKATAALEAFTIVEKHPPSGVSRAQLAHDKGRALYKLRHYKQAAKTLEQALRLGSPDKIGDKFYAARALSRADEDDKALVKYRALAREHKSSRWADEALYLSARLEMIHRRWGKAAKAYSKYLHANPKGKYKTAARYYRALCDFRLGHFKQAKSGFHTLVKEAGHSRQASSYLELEALSDMRAGNKEQAKKLFTEVIHQDPLSWPAMAAQSRLEELGVTVSSLIEPAANIKSPPRLEIKFPPKVELLRGLGLLDDAEQALSTVESSFGAGFGSQSNQALCEGYQQLGRATRAYRVAQNHVKASLLSHAPDESTHWAWDCFYPQPYPLMVRGSEQRDTLPNGILYAIMRQESGFRPAVVSPAKAVGLLQLLPTTAKQIAKRTQTPFEPDTLTNPSVNIDLGSRYFAMLFQMWKGNVAPAIASYNAGPRAVSHWIDPAGEPDLDVWIARIPYSETRHYVARVLGNWARYNYLQNGSNAVPKVPLSLPAGLRAESDAFLDS
jgi:soluble lytic murein transglycosylase